MWQLFLSLVAFFKKLTRQHVIYYNDRTEYVNIMGRHHRSDGPAVEYTNGRKEYFKNGRFHRIDGPAIEYADGSKAWYVNGLLHRTDGPAITDSDEDGYHAWYIRGKLHRLDGPAKIWGKYKRKEYWIDDIELDEERYNEVVKKWRN